jgi:murein DD-endopeptidase MepM/ murein hydrolase activator NlpD
MILLLVAAALFGWPVQPPSVVRPFDPPPQPWHAGHRGVDLAAAPAVVVHAAGAGTVVYAGVIAGRGVVSVAHPGGLRTTYEPVAPTVAVGDVVAAGDELGTLEAGHLGCPAAACLHWGLRRGDVYLDPLALLGLGRARLLPLVPGE